MNVESTRIRLAAQLTVCRRNTDEMTLSPLADGENALTATVVSGPGLRQSGREPRCPEPAAVVGFAGSDERRRWGPERAEWRGRRGEETGGTDGEKTGSSFYFDIPLELGRPTRVNMLRNARRWGIFTETLAHLRKAPRSFRASKVFDA